MASTDAAAVEATAGESGTASAQRARSIGELKELLTRHGIDHSRCLYRSDLEALAKGLPDDPPATVAHAEASARGKSRKGGSGSPSVESLAALDGPPLFAALRAISNESERRRVTAKVHAVKMALWRLKPAFRGMAQHLTEDVHPMFRDAFQQVRAILCGRVQSRHVPHLPFSQVRFSAPAKSAGASSSRLSSRQTAACTVTTAVRIVLGSRCLGEHSCPCHVESIFSLLLPSQAPTPRASRRPRHSRG